MDGRLRSGRALAVLWRRLPLGLLRGLVLSTLNTRFFVGTVGVVRDDYGRVLLFYHTYRAAASWGLPGGYLRAGEAPAQALVREVAEESGLIVGCCTLVGVVTWPGEAHLDVVYRARLVGGRFRPSAEVAAARLVAPHAVGVLSARDRHVLALAFRDVPGVAMVTQWLPFLILAILLGALPLAMLVAWRSDGSVGVWRAAVAIAVAEGLVIVAAAAWLSHPGEPLFWVLAVLGVLEIAAVLRLWRMFARF